MKLYVLIIMFISLTVYISADEYVTDFFIPELKGNYTGTVVNGTPQGQGIIKIKLEDIVLVYSGNFESGKLNGSVVLDIDLEVSYMGITKATIKGEMKSNKWFGYVYNFVNGKLRSKDIVVAHENLESFPKFGNEIEIYYENGKVYYSGGYKNNRFNGFGIYYHTSGQELCRGIWKDDVFEKDYKEFYLHMNNKFMTIEE